MKKNTFQEKYLNIARQIIEEISQKVSPYIKDSSQIKSLQKNPKGDITLTIDNVAEKCTEKVLRKNHLSGVMIGEEYGEKKIGKGDLEFILLIDPIDGSHNAKRGIPFFSAVVSFTPYVKNPTLQNVEVGMVKNLISGDIFVGIKGKGATLNGKKISPSSVSNLKNVDLIINLEGKTKWINRYSPLISHVRDVKRFGSCALELCYTACGAIDAFFDPRKTVSLLDTSASLLIAEESGCVITDAEGKKMNPLLSYDTQISILCAGNSALHRKIRKCIR